MSSPMPTALPYGMRDVKLTPYTDADGTVLGDTSVDLPNMQTLSFEEAEDFTDLRGDDRTVTTHGSGATVNWELQAGGISADAYAIMSGAVTNSGGVVPATVTTVRKLGSGVRPYFKAEGRVISDSGGDVHCILYRCRSNDTISGEFTDGDFFVTDAKGVALPMPDDANDLLYDFVFNETAVPLTTTPNVNPTSPTDFGGSE